MIIENTLFFPCTLDVKINDHWKKPSGTESEAFFNDHWTSEEPTKCWGIFPGCAIQMYISQSNVWIWGVSLKFPRVVGCGSNERLQVREANNMVDETYETQHSLFEQRL